MNPTDIEYVDFTWNPWTGCWNDCPYCYARGLANGRLKKRYRDHLRQHGLIDDLPDGAGDPFTPQFWPERLHEPLHVKKESRIFVVDMGDLFAPWVPREAQEEVIAVTQEADWHTYLFLTKFHHHLKKFNPWPANCWAGGTATDNTSFIALTAAMAEVDAVVRWGSLEPFLGKITNFEGIDVLDWLIVGAQTRPTIIPPDSHIREVATVASLHHIPLFYKDNLKWPAVVRNYPHPKEAQQ